MSAFLSRVDKTESQGIFEIDLDRKTGLPLTIKMLVLTGVKGVKKAKDGKNEHVAFRFDYALNNWGNVEKFSVPKAARKIIR